MDMILALCCVIPFGLILFGVRAGILMAQEEIAKIPKPHPNIWEQKEEGEDTFFYASVFMGEKDS